MNSLPWIILGWILVAWTIATLIATPILVIRISRERRRALQRFEEQRKANAAFMSATEGMQPNRPLP